MPLDFGPQFPMCQLYRPFNSDRSGVAPKRTACQYQRNGQIVRVINKVPNPPNKDVGEGLNTAFAAMKRPKLQEPIIQESPNAVVVNIRHQRLGTPEELILEYLKDHEEITNKIVRALTGIGSEKQCQDDPQTG